MAVCVAKQEELEGTSEDDTTAQTENNERKEILEAQNTVAQSNGLNKSKKQPKVSCMLLLVLCFNFSERVAKEKRTKSLLTQKLIPSLVRDLRNLMLTPNLRKTKK